MIRLFLIDLNPDELKFCSKICAPNKAKDINVKIFNIMIIYIKIFLLVCSVFIIQ